MPRLERLLRQELSGSTDIWSDEIESKVKELGEAYLEGREVFIRKLKELAFEDGTRSVVVLTTFSACGERFAPNGCVGTVRVLGWIEWHPWGRRVLGAQMVFVWVVPFAFT